MNRKIINYLLIIALSLFFYCCSKVQYIAEYDKATEDHLYKCALLVDELFEELLILDENKRTFEKVEIKYKNIEIELYKLLMLEQIRSKNQDSIEQANLIYEMWNDTIEYHKEKGTITDTMIQDNRKLYLETFTELIKCELIKKEKSQNKN